MQPSSLGGKSDTKQKAPLADGDSRQDAASIQSIVSQDTDMNDIDDSLGKSAQDAQADIKDLRVSNGLAKLMFGASIEKIRIKTVRASNANAHILRDLVVVFVGGNGGIGKSTALELFHRATAPKAYIIGRSVGDECPACLC